MGTSTTRLELGTVSRGTPWTVKTTEGVLWVAIVYCLLRGSPISDIRGLFGGTIVQSVMPDNHGIDAIVYAVNAMLLIALVAHYLHTIWLSKPNQFVPQVRGFVLPFGLFSLLHVLDFFTSTSDPFFFIYRWWVFPLLAAFFLSFLIGRFPAKRLAIIELIVFCTGIQAFYAVIYYLTGTNQFWTPDFGKRTMGTFDNPNCLYPLCLVAVGLGAGIVKVVPDRLSRYFFVGIILLLHPFLIFGYDRANFCRASREVNRQ